MTTSNRKSNYFLYVLFLLLVVLPGFSGTGCRPGGGAVGNGLNTGTVNVQQYQELWRQVDEFFNGGKPRSALEVVEKIHDLAQKENNHPQLVKALIHKMRFLQAVEEDVLVKVQRIFNDRIKQSPHSLTPLLHSMAAEQYWNYYRANRFRILNRTSLAGDIKEDDIRTWDARKLVQTVVTHYGKSLENPEESQKIRINIFDDILHKGNQGGRFRPTLYDFLAHRAVDFYKDNEAGLTQPGYRFTIDDPAYFKGATEFAAMNPQTKDSLSFDFQALIHLRNLVRFRLKDEMKGANPDALLDVDLKRLRFIFEKSVTPDKHIPYEKALRRIMESYKDKPGAAEAYFQLGRLYSTMGGRYQPGIGEEYKWYRKKAMEICRTAIKKYPGSVGASQCLALMHQIESRMLRLNVEKINSPGKPFRGLVQYANVNAIHYKIVKTSRNELEKIKSLKTREMVELFKARDAVKSGHHTLPDDGDYQQHSAEIPFEGLQSGYYAVLASNTDAYDYNEQLVAHGFFSVGHIAYFNRNRGKTGWEFHVVDRDTGAPLSGAVAQAWYRKYDRNLRRNVETKGEQFRSDRNGYFNIGHDDVAQKYFFLELIHGSSRLFLDRTFGLHPVRENGKSRTRTVFFTDRAIYRPGQTLYFKGIMLDVDPDEPEKNKILPNQATRVILYDVNGQDVARLDLKTNEYGTFSGVFQLPVGRLTGGMRIADAHGGTGFSMEEYKRPKFSVSFKPLQGTPRLGDTLSVTGEALAYAGYKIDNATVKYRVVRQVFYPYPWYFSFRFGSWGHIPSYPPMAIVDGYTKTRADGTFDITFRAIPDSTIPRETLPGFRYTLHADVTDINGETRSSQTSVHIGYTTLQLAVTPPTHMDRDKTEYRLPINSTNLSGEFVATVGNITVYKLKEPGRVLRSRLWQRPDRFVIKKNQYIKLFPHDVYDDEDTVPRWKREGKVFTALFDTAKSKEVVLRGLDKWRTGKYVVEMEAGDRYGTPIKDVRYFTLYSGKGNRPPHVMQDWFTVPQNRLEPGEKAVMYLGSSDRNVRVLYEIEHRGQIEKGRVFTLNNRQRRITLPITEKHRGNVGAHLVFVRHGRLISHTANFTVPWSNKELSMTFGTFRNKLRPGEDEQWRIKIKGPRGDKVAAEMVATLYDASLDAFRAHGWSFRNIFSSFYHRYGWQNNPGFAAVGTRFLGKRQKDYPTMVTKTYDRLNWFGFNWGMLARGRIFALTEEAPAPAPGRVGEAADEGVKKEERGMADGEARDGAETPAEAPESAPPIKARTNFNETAFFYPHLTTTPDGDVVISFTVPEALTRWKMMGFAHTRNLEYNFLFNELVTQKELMVVPNTPRFFREGDTLVYTSKITNLSEKELTGTARLQLFNAATMEPVDVKFKNTGTDKTFTAAKGQSALVGWRLEIPDGIGAVTCRLEARAGTFSDGEERAVPILTNRMLVTESMPLPVRASQTKTFAFKKLIDSGASRTLKHHRLTLEFTSNPVWYAVQALPYLMEYPHQCLEQTFSRYYANSIASHIVNSNPKIKRVFDLWQKAPAGSVNADALLSNLEKNQELKSLLLEETPWLVQGQNESQRKRRIALLFDLNAMAAQQARALQKLEQGQLASGGWPWFKGMRENRYITQYIVTGLAHLHRLGVIDARKNPRIWKMVREATLYLDTRISADYAELVRRDVDLAKNHLGRLQVHYLYARSYFPDIPLDRRDQTAFDYYKDQVKTYWTQFSNDKYGQGMMALAMKRYGDTETAVGIMESIKEHALYSEEMGMYWKMSYGYFWYQAPIETHALMVEAFDEVLNDAESVEGLKTWLLKQKQTQDWRTTKATTEACYALLMRGMDRIAESRAPGITLGRANPRDIVPGEAGSGQEGTDRETLVAQAGTGYFKTAWGGGDITPDMGHVTIRNHNDVAAWGSLYWQYFENLDKITPAQTPLKLEKKLFIEKTSDTGPVLHPLANGTPLKIGDRVKVRIVLRVDRNMEYVHMKDMRASCLEPEEVLSGYRWQGGLGYYRSIRDSAVNFFIDYLDKGTYVFEYGLRVTHEGNFSNGITSIQCMYAPEFTSHSEGVRIKTSN